MVSIAGGDRETEAIGYMAHGTARTRAIKSKERSRAGKEWQRLYKLKRWLDIRDAVLSQHPLCQRCPDNRKNASTVCHHVHRHNGDEVIFFSGPFEALCVDCHDGDVQQEEKLGYSQKTDVDGWPIDPRHPSNRTYSERTYSIPHSMRPSAVPVHVVVGPAGSGKSVYCRKRAQPGDMVIDLDDIAVAMGFERYGVWDDGRKSAMRRRDDMLRSLADRTSGECWFIVHAPSDDERRQWLKALGPLAQLHVMDTEYATCIARIRSDPERKGNANRMCDLVEQYALTRQHPENVGK